MSKKKDELDDLAPPPEFVKMCEDLYIENMQKAIFLARNAGKMKIMFDARTTSRTSEEEKCDCSFCIDY